MDPVSYDDFAKLQLRVARVLSVAPHPDADKLYLLRIDGGGEERQLVAGLRPYYTPEELLDRYVVVIWNLAPAVIRGQESQGMLLAAQDGAIVSFLTPERAVGAGSKVR
ncbi:MAG: hypothetical protein AB7O52_12190 [Planctomycetota bacterium]